MCVCMYVCMYMCVCMYVCMHVWNKNMRISGTALYFFLCLQRLSRRLPGLSNEKEEGVVGL